MTSRWQLAWEALRDPESPGRYRVAERIARQVHAEAVLPERGKLWAHDHWLRAQWERIVGSEHHRGLERVWNVRQFAAMTADVPGDTAECGVLQGMSSWAILDGLRGADHHHHGFDSFAGLSEPTAADGSYWSRGDLASDADVARVNLAEFAGRFTLHEGWIPEVLANATSPAYRFVHIDVDLYEPTRASLAHFGPRMSPGGIIVCDDYGFATCPGALAAVDEHLEQSGAVRFVHLSSGQGVLFHG